jgi:hypothetical protein
LCTLGFQAKNGVEKSSEKMKKFFTTKTPRKELTTKYLARPLAATKISATKTLRHKEEINHEFALIGTKGKTVIRGTGDQDVDIRMSGRQETGAG